MKTTFAVILCVMPLLFFACAPKVNDPADVAAIKKTLDDYTKATNAGDVEGVVALMTDKAFYADLNLPVAAGKDAIRSAITAFNSMFKPDFSLTVDEVRVAGDLATARGTWTVKLIPKVQDLAPIIDGGSWIVVSVRQNDGSWKWDWVIPNSNRPLPGSTTNGEDEQALLQIERDWAQAMQKSDAVAFDRHIAKEWTYNSDGQGISKAQMLGEIRSGAYKLTSMEMRDLNPHVFGDVAVVSMTADMKGKYKGSDIPTPQRSIDFFVKRDGQWQVVNTQNITIK
jgi:uncharacterized protein (TIGR02246 family)